MKTISAQLINLSIDGLNVKAEAGQTLLQVAEARGIYIPTLCHDPRLKPWGACRLCLVEVEGARNPVPACATIATPDMKVTTNNSRLHQLRKNLLELIISDHPLDCITCEKCGNCRLQDLAYQFGISSNKFSGKKHPVRFQAEDPFIERNLDKCILCGRCVRICDEVESALAIDFIHRGFNCQIGTPFGKSLKETTCEFCGQCISTCPVGALVEKPRLDKGRVWQLNKTLTTCPYCGVGCTLELQTKDNTIINVSSPIEIGVNKGNLCVKGRFGYKFVGSSERLTTPLQKRNGKFVPISWDKAIEVIADKLGEIKREYGANALAGLSSAKCTNEENYLFQKFVRACLGTNNVDHCARLCHASTVAGLARTFGSAAMTNSISDIKEAEAILVIGSNTTEAHPIIGIEILQAVRQRGTKLIVIDPRGIKLTKFADVWLRQKPGTDVAVLSGIMQVILTEGLIDEKFIRERTENFEAVKEVLLQYTPEKAEKISGVPAEKIIQAARIYGGSKASAIFFSMGITQHTTGTDNVQAIANLAMMTGNIGRPGTGVNPLRGQNNVQGACDMGALYNVFPGYAKVNDDVSRSKFEKFWQTKLPKDGGLSVVEIFNAAASGSIKGLYIMGENPMISDPDAGHVEEALSKLDFLVVQDIFLSETAQFADIVLPGAAFAERNGTFTNTERRVQLINPAVKPPGEAREDWRIIADVSTALGYPMNYNSSSEILREINQVVSTYAGITPERLAPGQGIQWPCPDVEHPGTPILHVGKFTRGKGHFYPVDFKPPQEEPDIEYPLVLTTGRLLNQFHTGTMVRRSPGIDEIFAVASVEINPKDAVKYEIENGDEITLATRRGKIKVKALVTERSPKGVLFMPFHFREAVANKLTNPALDPVAKIPEFKVCAVKICK